MLRIPEFSLRVRFVASILAVVSIAFAGFYFAVDQFLGVLEAQLLDRTLTHELHEFAEDYRRNPATRPPSSTGMKAYVAVHGIAEDLPPRLKRLSPDWPELMHVNGREYLAGRTDVGDARLYLMVDVQPVDELQQRLETVAWAIGITALVAAVLVALWLTRVVTGPMRRIAETIAATDPGERDHRVSLPNVRRAGKEFAMIASAFERFLDRMDQFVAREQAFTEDASHELRTPLAVILSSVQLLETNTRLDERTREKLHRIHRSAEQIQSLIDALMFLAREEAAPEGESCNMRTVVDEAVEDCEPQASLKGVRINVNAINRRLEVPAVMASCVVTNLLQNAVHYTDNGEVTVTLTRDALMVQDTGKGIAPEDLSHIFERHYRGPQSRGLGLGLYLIKRICDRLGWVVHAENNRNGEKPGGARFVVNFSERP